MQHLSTYSPFPVNIWLLLLLFSCVEQIDIGDFSNDNPQLIVEGSVNDVDDSFYVSLTTSHGILGVGTNTMGINAQVTINVGDGRVIALSEELPGIYATIPGALTGIVGESYQLSIVLENGATYLSDQVTIQQPVGLGDTRISFLEERSESDNGTPFVSYSHEVFTQLENTDDDHFIRIEAIGWEQLRVDYGFEPGGPLECWAFRDPINRQVKLSTNIGLSGTFYEAPVVNIPVEFRGDYIVEVQANAMSLESYNYWEAARLQIERKGGVFDPPFAPVIGNIRNVNDPNEIVLGYFHAYARTTTRHCYSRLGIPGEFPIPILPVTITCVEFHAPATFELPFADGLCTNVD